MNPFPLILDSGSDITLISEKFCKSIKPALKPKTGLRVSLTQVTSKGSPFTGFVSVPIFLETNKGTAKMTVEAYVVPNMNTPFLLGNDFATQYSISLLRDEGMTTVRFGKSGPTMTADSAISPLVTNDAGETISTKSLVAKVDKWAEKRVKEIFHRRSGKKRRSLLNRRKDKFFRAFKSVTIAPESSMKVPLDPELFRDNEPWLAERLVFQTKNDENFFATPTCIVDHNSKFLHVSNFSSTPVTIIKGQALAYHKKAVDGLDKSSEETPTVLAYVSLIKTLVKEYQGLTNPDLPPEDGSPPVVGGPKTSEPEPDPVAKGEFLKAVDINSALPPEQRKQIENILLKNINAFSLDGKPGNRPTNTVIKLKEGAEPVSLPPFPVSPAKRQVIDEQMDAWISHEVIHPSKSPWGAPAFIIMKDGKPRMVIDFRKMNELVVPDEFPLPRQEDIFTTLNGCQWLSTFDALYGFHQIDLHKDSQELTVFRTHRGLWEFSRLPLGYRNGPAVFQRIMQDILAPFLWIFALVYIDDIVIFSKSFEDHLTHMDKVLSALAEAGITLSPKKSHLGYQSLRLLGQKVSRLGMSTHREKIEAILELSTPTNIKDLLMFLGMTVYYASYIPFYAWLAAPLFRLLRTGIPWEWTDLQEEAYLLLKECLSNAPVRAYPMPKLGYRLYSDACEHGLAAILQQIQPILIRDLRGTRIYDRLFKAFNDNLPVPRLVVATHKDAKDIPPQAEWAPNFEDTVVHVERVIAYWSRTLKAAERNYSATEREALALKEGLIKFQSYIEGEHLIAITDHSALTWSRVFQNVNKRLLSWGTIIDAYPNLKIVHRAGRVHSNVNPISRLRRNLPPNDGPRKDTLESINVSDSKDLLKDMYSELSPKFEQRLNKVVKGHKLSEEAPVDLDIISTLVEPPLTEASALHSIPVVSYLTTATQFELIVHLSESEIQKWATGYNKDNYFSKIINEQHEETDVLRPRHPQYTYTDQGLLYFEDDRGRMRLCVPESLIWDIIKEDHDSPSNGAHAGYHRSYNRLASVYFWPKMLDDVKKFVQTCDICQLAKTRKHAAYGLLRPIPYLRARSRS